MGVVPADGHILDAVDHLEGLIQLLMLRLVTSQWQRQDAPAARLLSFIPAAHAGASFSDFMSVSLSIYYALGVDMMSHPFVWANFGRFLFV